MRREKERAALAAVLAEHCIRCSGSKRGSRIKCTREDCPLYSDLYERFYLGVDALLTDVAAKCRDCMLDQRKLVRTCTQTECLLWRYRDSQAQAEIREAAYGK